MARVTCRFVSGETTRHTEGREGIWLELGAAGACVGILVGCMHWMGVCTSICCCPPLPRYTRKVRTKKMAKHEREQLRPANEGCFGVSGGSTCRLGTGMKHVGREIPCSNYGERRLGLRGEVWTARDRGQSKGGVGVWQHQGCDGAVRRARRGAPWSGTPHSPPAYLPLGRQ